MVDNANDCNDDDQNIYIGAKCEIAGAGSCAGYDASCTCVAGSGTLTTYYADMDKDGFGDPANFIETCEGQPEGYVLNN